MLFQKYDFCLNSLASAEFIPAQRPQRHCVVRFNPQTGHSRDCKDCLAVRFKGWTEGVRLLNDSRGCHYCWSLFRQRKSQIPNETDSFRLWPSVVLCLKPYRVFFSSIHFQRMMESFPASLGQGRFYTMDTCQFHTHHNTCRHWQTCFISFVSQHYHNWSGSEIHQS